MGSPAKDWASGPAGIEVSKAPLATGAFGTDEVAAQLQLVKDYLVAANLDPQLIAGGSPDAALAMLDRGTKDTARQALAHPSPTTDPSSWFTRFDPREAIPVSDAIRVQGWISYDADGENGVVVKTDVTYVYALRPGPEAVRLAASPGTPATGPATPQDAVRATPDPDVPGYTWTARTIVRRADTFHFYDPARYAVDPKKIVADETRPSFGNSACNVHDGYLHPEFDQFPPARPNPTGPTRDPYERTGEVPGKGGCNTISRS
ncbi:hypothetical protein [Kitasatospora sp. A2-31]|uniref:hypothetical protein n=1 Tax=Kitasatospora sp. A2-31 TaxID=2916414 RepID=UPI001EECA0EE|nr:hypothetical protein [Kitasatospora sp. A2-31]MCG6497251.1 hypothetical protein [Kitasatospora sp. A2-31]